MYFYEVKDVCLSKRMNLNENYASITNSKGENMNNLYLIYILGNMIDDVFDSEIDLVVNLAVNRCKNMWIDK